MKAVIFDMDGVIIDSEPLYKIIQEQFFAQLGFAVTDEEYDTFIGLGLKTMWQNIRKIRQLPYSLEELIYLNNEKIYQFFAECQNLLPMPGFNGFLNDCHRRRILTAVASSTASRVIETILKKLNVLPEFDVIVSGEEVLAGKPAPDIFLETARRLNVQPADCLVIEDSFNGVKAAKSAGMFCIGLQNPNSGCQNLKAAEMIVNGFAEIDLESIL